MKGKKKKKKNVNLQKNLGKVKGSKWNVRGREKQRKEKKLERVIERNYRESGYQCGKGEKDIKTERVSNLLASQSLLTSLFWDWIIHLFSDFFRELILNLFSKISNNLQLLEICTLTFFWYSSAIFCLVWHKANESRKIDNLLNKEQTDRNIFIDVLFYFKEIF